MKLITVTDIEINQEIHPRKGFFHNTRRQAVFRNLFLGSERKPSNIVVSDLTLCSFILFILSSAQVLRPLPDIIIMIYSCFLLSPLSGLIKEANCIRGLSFKQGGNSFQLRDHGTQPS